MKSRGINDRKLLWNFPLPILTSWDFFKWLKFGGHSWQEPVIGHFFLVHDLLTYGIYWCLKGIARKKKHFHKSYSSFLWSPNLVFPTLVENERFTDYCWNVIEMSIVLYFTEAVIYRNTYVTMGFEDLFDYKKN